ncbi:MAG: sulfur carrier protein ThiS [Chitinispirillales bacterium]|jgi:thiamine biosynthesis protein ThiS|nr:sulfur carrier protein ThiS [Chitinispirillales bacterium]
MIVNGKEIILQKEISLKVFLEKKGYDLARIAVEKNGIIVEKNSFETEKLCCSDKIEIVSFVGGG